MVKKRNVVLFGSGGVMDWNAPSTNTITKELLSSGFKTKDNKTTITQYIYNCLKDADYSEDEINFETIINVIEELIVHYSNSDSLEKILTSQKLKSLHSVFFDAKFEKDIFNCAVVGEEVKHGFKLEIPKGQEYPYGRSAVNFETPKQMFLQLLLACLLTDIISLVDKYSYNGKHKIEILKDRNTEMDFLFFRWIQSINKNGILRMYTLNYDRNFKYILENSKDPIEVFEGFDSGSIVEYGAQISPNISRILNDFETHTHYNLHGCAYWDVEARNYHQLPQPKIFLTAFPNFPINNYEQAIWQSERGKTIMLTNIITGYQKVQKGIFAPFKQMQAAFDRDCNLADNLYIIGYSFSDEHINATIRTALEYNKYLQVIIVNDGFTTKNFDLNVVLKVFSASNNLVPPYSLNNKLHVFLKGQILVHLRKFKEYLSDTSLFKGTE